MAAGADGQSVAALFEDGTGKAAHVPLLAVPGGEQELSAVAHGQRAMESVMDGRTGLLEGSAPSNGSRAPHSRGPNRA